MSKEVTYAQAIGEALDEEFARDPDTLLLGEDVGLVGGNFKTSVGLLDKYGPMRVRDTPISEAGFVGMAVGMALTGLRPVVDLMFSDFLGVAMDQIANQAAKIRYMSGGQASVPLTIRMPIGGGRSSAAQHSQSLQSWVAYVPGLKVVMPSSAAEAKGLLKTAIRDNSPVIFMEHKMQYNKKFAIPEGEYTIPFGKANIVHPGDRLTIAATSDMVLKARDAAQSLAQDGIMVEVLDLRTLVPLDRESIIHSVKKTGRLLILDEGHANYGVHGEIALSVLSDVFYDLDMPIMHMGTASVPLPFSPALELPLIPNTRSIYEKAKQMAG